MTYPTAQLGDVADIIRGITFKPDDLISVDETGAVVCFRTKNVQAQLDQDDLIAIPKSFVRRKDQFVGQHDILVSSANSWNLVGKCSYVPKIEYDATAGGFISILRGRNTLIDSRFLFHWFSSPNTQALLRSFGRKTTNISNLNIPLTLKASLPLPPLEEQRRIAEVLDKADALRQKRRLAVQKLDTLLQSVFLEMFGDPVKNPKGWKTHELSELCVGKYGIKAGPFGSSLKKDSYAKSGYRIYGQEQVIGGDFTIGDYYIDEAKFSQMKAYEVKTNDLLVSLVGTIGKLIVVPNGIERGIINPRLLKITPRSEILDSHFLKSLLESDSVQKHLREISHGGTMSILNAGILKTLRVILPPTSLQTKFSSVLGKIIDSCSSSNAAAAETERLFSSFQFRSFNGTLFKGSIPSVGSEAKTLVAEGDEY